jgi:hypothetical protein
MAFYGFIIVDILSLEKILKGGRIDGKRQQDHSGSAGDIFWNYPAIFTWFGGLKEHSWQNGC